MIIELLTGKTVTGVFRWNWKSLEDDSSTQTLMFTCSDGTRYCMGHDFICCEQAYIESIDGNLNDLVSEVIVNMDRLITCGNDTGDRFTYYRLITGNNVRVIIKWLSFPGKCCRDDCSKDFISKRKYTTLGIYFKQLD